MTFTSYAQNFEDVMLWRALKHVHSGFYIDVGANDPIVDSVTLAFYERGWHGINIEPVEQYYERLHTERPRDINLELAVGESDGELTLYDIPDTGLSTLESAIGTGYVTSGKNVVERRVRVVPLKTICEKHVRGEIHFLKIDVEGFEKSVILGMDFQRWRPWIVVIEATKPQSHVTTHAEWESIVLNAGYRFAHFDGLNHYYVANEHGELVESLRLPPNYFDHFRLRPGHAFSYPIGDLELRVQHAETEVKETRAAAERAEALTHQAETRAQRTLANAQQLQSRIHQLEAQVALTNEHLGQMIASASWRVTRPLRVLKRLIVSPRSETALLRNALRTALRKAAKRGMSWMVQRKRLRQIVRSVLIRFPHAEQRARDFYFRIIRSQVPQIGASSPNGLQDMPESARRILADIELVLDQQRLGKQ